jgi:hypothetical protein
VSPTCLGRGPLRAEGTQGTGSWWKRGEGVPMGPAACGAALGYLHIVERRKGRGDRRFGVDGRVVGQWTIGLTAPVHACRGEGPCPLWSEGGAHDGGLILTFVLVFLLLVLALLVVLVLLVLPSFLGPCSSCAGL